MTMHILQKQFKYCLLGIEDEELILLKKKRCRREIPIVCDSKIRENNLKYFELEKEYKKLGDRLLSRLVKNKLHSK